MPLTANETLEVVTLSGPVLDDGDPIFPEIYGNNGGSRGCQWNYSICTEFPTHHITWFTDPGTRETDAEVFCGRHYTTTLVRFIKVHPVESHCPAPALAHIADYGEI